MRVGDADHGPVGGGRAGSPGNVAAATGSDEDEVYEVEAVLRSRQPAGKPREYLVSWAGYDSSENTWEPEHCLGGAATLLAEFEAAAGSARR